MFAFLLLLDTLISYDVIEGVILVKIVQFPNNIFPNKSSVLSCSHCSCTIFFNFIPFVHKGYANFNFDVQYLRNHVFCFEKVWEVKITYPQFPTTQEKNTGKISHSIPLPLKAVWKTLVFPYATFFRNGCNIQSGWSYK